MTNANKTTCDIAHEATGEYRPWLHRYAMAFVGIIVALLALGGTVTSKGVGLAVPDWPTSFGYNMILFPIDMWTGGIFWEHTHRLLAEVVGVLTIIMTIWVWLTQKHRPWLCWFATAALVVVIGQGIMGGLRVTQISIAWAIFHGITAQLFLCMAIFICAATSKWWTQRDWSRNPRTTKPITKLAIIMLAAILIQLSLGAVVRHTGSGLAITDFPASFGQVIPPLTQAGIDDAINAIPYERIGEIEDARQASGHNGADLFQPWRVGIHFAHRAWALVLSVLIVWLGMIVLRRAAGQRLLIRPTVSLFILLAGQIALGASVIWTIRHPEVATLHQTLGAILLATAFMLTVRLFVLPLSKHNAAVDKASSNKRINTPTTVITHNTRQPQHPQGASA